MKTLSTIMCLLVSLMAPMAVYASTPDDVYRSDNKQKKGKTAEEIVAAEGHMIYVNIPKKLKIKDKIFLVNHTNCTILHAAIAAFEFGKKEPIANVSYLRPSQSYCVMTVDDNKLKALRGKTLAIKIKGAKGDICETNPSAPTSGKYYTLDGTVVPDSGITPEALQSITPDMITYDFKASLKERDHDLYITVTSSNDDFDF